MSAQSVRKGNCRDVALHYSDELVQASTCTFIEDFVLTEVIK